MRISLLSALGLPVLAVLTASASAATEGQKPLTAQLSSWYSKAKSYIPTVAHNPLDAGAAAVASAHLVALTRSNWETALAPSYNAHTDTYGPDAWMVLVTGWNRTCGPQCGAAEVEFNKSIAILSSSPSSEPHFALLNCDEQPILCHQWFAGPPSLWYILRQQHTTPIHVVHFNASTVTAQDFVNVHKLAKYRDTPAVDSWFHPFDGLVRQYGLQTPVAYVLYVFGAVPSWSIMLAVSFMSRQFM